MRQPELGLQPCGRARGLSPGEILALFMVQGVGTIRELNHATQPRRFSTDNRRSLLNRLTDRVNVHTFTADMGRPRIPEDRKRSKLFPLRLSPRETEFFSRKARALGESIASVFR